MRTSSVLELLERVRDGAQRARHVRLEDDPQLLGLAGLDLAVEVLEGGPAAPSPALAAAADLAGLDQRRGRSSRRPTTRRMSPASGTSDRPRMHDGAGRAGLLARACRRSFSSARTLPNVSPTTMMSPTWSVPVWTSARRDGAATLVQLRLDDRADRRAVRVGLELLEVGDEEDHLEQLVEAIARSWRRPATSGTSPPYSSMTTPASVSSVLTRSGLASGLSILLSAMTIGTLAALAWLIASSVWGMTPSSAATTMHRDVGDPGAAGTHGGERLVTRGVEEDDALAVVVDLGRTDVLGDAAALAGGDLGRADGVEQAGLAVVDVAHDGHDRRRAAAGASGRRPRTGPPWWPRARRRCLAVRSRCRSPTRPRPRRPRSRAPRRRATRCRGR